MFLWPNSAVQQHIQRQGLDQHYDHKLKRVFVEGYGVQERVLSRQPIDALEAATCSKSRGSLVDFLIVQELSPSPRSNIETVMELELEWSSKLRDGQC
jgi:hypothetical protein